MVLMADLMSGVEREIVVSGLRRGAIGVSLLVVGLAGCTDSPGHSPTARTTTVPVEQAVGRIDLDGTTYIPLHWRDPDGGLGADDPETAQALLAARRYLALTKTWYHHPHPEELLPLLPAIASGTLLSAEQSSLKSEILRPEQLPDAPSPERLAPLWLWVQQVQQDSPTRVRVEVCVDDYWYEASFDNDERPRREFHGNINTVWVEQVPDHGSRHWKATDYVYDGARLPDDPTPDPALRERCDAWTRGHTELPARVPQDLFTTRTS
ncbi:MAG: hypothetical protein GXX79_19410 [Actinomycetales bacterium]|nr:hypothetical protein [Actinomycetales bacterium]